MRFSETTDYESLRKFYEENGLEVSDDIERDDNAVFSLMYKIGNSLTAAATLSFRKSVFILDYIAVSENHRKEGLGKEALGLIKSKAKNLGAEAIYITARNPMFFKAQHFEEGSPEGIDMNEDCKGCSQFGKTCVSVPMMLKLV